MQQLLIECIRLNGQLGQQLVLQLLLWRMIAPLALVDQLPRAEPQLEASTPPGENGNPTAFPNTSIFNESWEDWR